MLLLHSFMLLLATAAAVPSPQADTTQTNSTQVNSTGTSVCSGNTAEDRSVWCDYSTSTDYYTEAPDTGVTREYWLEITNTTLAPDGVERIVLTVNGTIPGPKLEANWGDTMKIHVTNKLMNNGTGIHWHGVRQNWTVQNDGVPSITQCPIAPGDSLTYTWKAVQYGTSWYHSHYFLQAWDGVAGPIVIHGPATANYDEELDTVFLTDWSHNTSDSLYHYSQVVGPPVEDTGLINGLNVYNDTGSRYETDFVSGTKYLIRLINGAIDTHFKFSIDNHNLTVIANDFVPIVPWTTDVLDIAIGQRYDIIVEANQASANYWMRAIPQLACSNNDNPDNIRAIIRYDNSSTSDPTTTAWNQTDSCVDPPLSSLVPFLSQTVVNPTLDQDNLTVTVFTDSENLFEWKIAPESFQVEYTDPTLLQIYDGNTTFSAQQDVYKLPNANEWVYFVIQTALAVPHPIHLHGHDFYVLATAEAETYNSSVELNFDNPMRRDVALLPASGYLIIAFLTDNPGAWLMHCHIGWHQSEGLALQFIEQETQISALIDYDVMNSTCAAWDAYAASVAGPVEIDSGI